MNTDRDLIAAAAKAAGYNFQWEPALLNEWPEPTVFTPEGFGQYWNPLTDDGDALRLAVKLEISVCPYTSYAIAADQYADYEGRDQSEVVRRCIVRAAAALAPTPKEKAE